MSSHVQPTANPGQRKPVTLHSLRAMHARREKITMLTAYDATFARLADESGLDTLLVGDSLGMLLQGHSSTLPVTLAEMAYHTRCVARGLQHGGAAWLIADLPFGSYQQGPSQAMASAEALMQAGAQMVKLEGGGWTAETVHFLVERGVPVCAHIGLTPQAVHQLGGYRVQGRSEEGAARLKADAHALEQAGAALMVMEMVPATLAAEITASLKNMATIGIGAGPGCDGQVLVLHDLLGVFPGKTARFVRNFMEGAASIEEAVARYAAAVKDGSFPAAEHCY